MAIGAYFHPGDGMSVQQYDDVTSKLEAAGFGMPAGRIFHSAFVEGGGISVYDIWESQEALDSFFRSLEPILAEAGVDPGEPSIAEMHNMIWGQR